ncbi:MAG TPA: AAA family ATPase, partial [Solirubrobacteraceae bacterium]
GASPDADALVARARTAADAERWMEALDLASQALAVDPRAEDAAALVGVARNRLGALGAAATAELRELTVVAVDTCGSTAIAAAIGPERYRQLMLELYEACVEAFVRYDGRVTKYVGDGVLAQFGHPIAHEDDARRAVLAALALIEGVRKRGPGWRQRLGAEVEIRIGLDSGTVAIGPMDASPWATDEIAGDPPNVASRVQAQAEPMTVLVTEATRNLTAGWFITEPIGTVPLRNYPRPVQLHRVHGPTDAESRLEASVRERPALVDRQAELARLRAAVAHVERHAERRVVGLVGPPGIGKSRLADHIRGTAMGAGATPVAITCSNLQRSSPLRPVARALRRIFRLPPRDQVSDEDAIAAIRAHLAELPNRRTPTDDAVALYAWLLARGPAPELEPDVLRKRAFDAVVDLFEALASTAMLVVNVDDVDAGDPSTIELLAALLARPRDTAMLVVLTGRGPLPPELVLDEEIALTGLPAGDAAALARAVGPSLEDETVRRIVARCDGVPFYIEELAVAARDTDDEVRPEPAELSAFVAARLDELAPEQRRLVSQLAVAGREARVDVLARVAGVDSAAFDALVGALSAQGIVRRSRAAGGEIVRFRHDVMREVAYQTLLASRRAELHGALARALAALPAHAVRPEDLAHHYALAGDHVNAAEHWLQAARAAVVNGAHREAAELFENTLEAVAHLPESPARSAAELEAQLGRGNALSTLRGYTSPHAREAFEEAARLAERREDSTAIFPAIWGIWSYWFVLGEHATAAELATRLQSIAEQNAHDERFRWTAAGIVGYQRLAQGDLAGAREALTQGSRHAGVEPAFELPNDPGLASMGALAVVLWLLGEHDESNHVAAQAFEQAQALDPNDRLTALTRSWTGCYLAWQAQLRGDADAAIELAELAATIAAEHGQVTWIAAATMHRSIALCLSGRLDEGLPVLGAMVDAWRAAGRDSEGRQQHQILMTPYFAGRYAEALLLAGEHEAAAQQIDLILSGSAANGERFWDGALLALKASLPDPEVQR